MKRKRKQKITRANVWKQVVIEMTWQGFSRGMLLGGLYGSLMLLSIGQYTDYVQLPDLLLTAICVPLPFGAFVGMIAGVILGILNGVLVGLLTRLFFVPMINWKLYRFSVGVFSVLCTLAGGIFIFSAVFSRSATVYFRDFVYITVPALIAAIVLGHASQRAARWYLAAIRADEPVEAATWFRW